MKIFKEFFSTNKGNNQGLFFKSSMFVAVLATFFFTISFLITPAYAQSGGPLILMGIDAEDGGPGGHGPVSVYVSVTNSVYNAASNGGTGVLVIGGGKSPTDNVTTFWNAVASGSGQSVTYVNGATNITNQSFSGFRVIVVVSSVFETSSGGLTQAENTALTGRSAAVATFVNNGGGLLGFSQSGLIAPLYGYLSGVGTFTVSGNQSYQDITPTAAGTDVGITNALDVCCWHDIYTSFPPSFSVLATNATTGQAAAIGNLNTFIGTITLSPANSTQPVGGTQTLTALVAENNMPIANRAVTLTILTGPNAGQMFMATTNAMGNATFMYSSSIAGTDTLRASYIDSQGMTRQSNTVTVVWTGSGTPTPTPTPHPGSGCTPSSTVMEGDLAPGGTASFVVTSGQGSVAVDHVDRGTGLQSLTVVGTPTNATVNIPAFTPGTVTPVIVTFSVTNTDQPVDFTLRAASQFHSIFIRVRCNRTTCTPSSTVMEGDLATGGTASFLVTTGMNSVTIDHVDRGTGLQSLTVVGTPTNATVNIPVFTPGTITPVMVTFTPTDPSQAVNFRLRAASQFHSIFIDVRCAVAPPIASGSKNSSK